MKKGTKMTPEQKEKKVKATVNKIAEKRMFGGRC